MTIQSNRSQPSATKDFYLRLLTCLVCLSFVLPYAARAQTTTPAPLPPEAEAAIKKGIIAAKEQEWLIAIQSFQDARKTAPDSPVVFYNLGLAESKLPGRELRAIAWFGAYLTANPNAPNAAAVNDFIAGLQIKNHGNINRLIKTTQDAASQTGNQDHWDDVARLWLEAGDLAAALKTADLNHAATDTDSTVIAYDRGLALSKIAKAQAEAGDMAGAKKTFESALQTADLIRSTYKDRLLFMIVQYQASAGDIPGAQKSAALINHGESGITEANKSDLQISIAKAQAKLGDIAGAQETLAAALKVANSIHDPWDAMNALEDLDRFQVDFGDIPGAKATLTGVLKDWSLVESKKLKTVSAGSIAQSYEHLGEAQLKSGDIAGAKESLRESEQWIKIDPSEADSIRYLQRDIEYAEAKAGRPNESASMVNPTPTTQAVIKPVSPEIKISDWVDKLDDKGTYDSVCPLNTDPFLDLAGYLTAQRSDDPHKLFYALKEAAEKIIKAQNVMDKMLKQQAEH